MNNINERLDNLKLEIQKPEFLEGKGLSNEVNIRIFCYDAQDEMRPAFYGAADCGSVAGLPFD